MSHYINRHFLIYQRNPDRPTKRIDRFYAALRDNARWLLQNEFGLLMRETSLAEVSRILDRADAEGRAARASHPNEEFLLFPLGDGRLGVLSTRGPDSGSLPESIVVGRSSSALERRILDAIDQPVVRPSTTPGARSPPPAPVGRDRFARVYRIGSSGNRSSEIILGQYVDAEGRARDGTPIVRKTFEYDPRAMLELRMTGAGPGVRYDSANVTCDPIRNLRWMQRIQHPHLIRVAQVRGLRREDTECLLYTPWYAGGTMANHHRFGRGDRIAVCLDALDGLHHLNVALDTLHYDIKPENIFVQLPDASPHGRLTGVVGDVNELIHAVDCRDAGTKAYQLATTPCYGAPFRHCDPRRDLVAMVLTVAEIVSGVDWRKICRRGGYYNSLGMATQDGDPTAHRAWTTDGSLYLRFAEAMRQRCMDQTVVHLAHLVAALAAVTPDPTLDVDDAKRRYEEVYQNLMQRLQAEPRKRLAGDRCCVS